MSFVGSGGSFLGDPIAQVEWGYWVVLCKRRCTDLCRRVCASVFLQGAAAPIL